MRALRVAAGGLLLLALPWNGEQTAAEAASSNRGTGSGAATPSANSAADPLGRGVSLFAERQFAAAAVLLEQVLRSELAPAQRDEVSLVLGICYYRLGEVTRAEKLLRQAVRSQDAEINASARLFLARLFAEQGADDEARGELREIAGAPTLRDAAQSLLRQARPHRLQFTLLLSPEYDGNVPLTDIVTWRNGGTPSQDGDLLFLASASLRPLGNGFVIGDTLAYRQQFQLLDYDLLLNSTWIGYSYFGRANRLRVAATFNYALLGASSLYVDGDAKAIYRRALRGALGLLLSYDAHYRDYRNTDYAQLSGFMQTLQVGLDWGLPGQALRAGFGYSASREQTRTPDASEPLEDDFRAWAHGPYGELRARHRRFELTLRTTFLHRVFDSGRVDYSLLQDLGLSVTLRSWLELFAGSTLIYNRSSNPIFHYFKPTASLGIAAYFGVL